MLLRKGPYRSRRILRRRMLHHRSLKVEYYLGCTMRRKFLTENPLREEKLTLLSKKRL